MSADQYASVASDQDPLDDDHLFGSGSENEGSEYDKLMSQPLPEADRFDSAGSVVNKRRKLDDQELDSDDDEGRDDRLENGVDGHGQEEEFQDASTNVLSSSIGRQPDPQPSDGEVNFRRETAFADLWLMYAIAIFTLISQLYRRCPSELYFG